MSMAELFSVTLDAKTIRKACEAYVERQEAGRGRLSKEPRLSCSRRKPMDNFEILADRGDESEDDARDRLAAQWQLQAPPMREFMETYFELTIQIALAACAYDDVPSELHRVEMVRAVDTAREAFIQQELRL